MEQQQQLADLHSNDFIYQNTRTLHVRTSSMRNCSKIRRTAEDTDGRIPKIVIVTGQFQFATGHCLVNTEVCVELVSKWVALFFSISKNIKRIAVIWFFTRENDIFIGDNRKFMAFNGEDSVNISTVRCWMGKSRNLHESFDPKTSHCLEGLSPQPTI
jgi:hypothetical protein